MKWSAHIFSTSIFQSPSHQKIHMNYIFKCLQIYIKRVQYHEQVWKCWTVCTLSIIDHTYIPLYCHVVHCKTPISDHSWSINQSINQTAIVPISLAKPDSVAQQPNQCSTAKSRKQFRIINRPWGVTVSMGERPSQRGASSDISWSWWHQHDNNLLKSTYMSTTSTATWASLSVFIQHSLTVISICIHTTFSNCDIYLFGDNFYG